MMLFSLIIPCYNEAKGLPQLIEKCRKAFESRNDVEIIFVNNGSSDDTVTILENLLNKPWLKQVHVKINKGYGFGILQGLEAAKGDIIGWTHADLQTDPADFLKVIEIYQGSSNKNIFFKGKRFGRSLGDVFFTIGMSIFETLLFGSFFWDINAQPTCLPKTFFENWKGKAPHDFSLDLYVYLQAKRAQFQIKRFPVKFGPRQYGTSHWNSGLKSRLKFIHRTLAYSLTLRKENNGNNLPSSK